VTLPGAIWHVDGDTAIPTELARGPWSPHAQHGGAPSSLLAGLLERFEPGPADFTARLNIDLMRPVPIAPLRVERVTLRPGKKVQIVQGSLFADDVEVVRATALRIRTVDRPYADIEPRRTVEPLPAPSDPEPFPMLAERDVGFWHTIEMSNAFGAFGEPSARTAVWFRLLVPVIDGEVPSPLQRVAAVSDFANGLGMAVPRDRYSFINPDLTIVLHRAPVGEWVALDGTSFPEDTGIGVAEAALHDERGRIGRALQTVILDRR
jgi:hypothetical protein